MRNHEDLWTAVRARERSRALVRGLTVAAGAAGLISAGVVAYTLPAPAHQQPGGSQPAAQPSQPAAQVRSGDDAGGDDGRSASPQRSPSQSSAATPAQTPPQVTSGGS